MWTHWLQRVDDQCPGLQLGDAEADTASMANFCVVISWYLQRGVERIPEVILKRFSEDSP